MSILDDISKRFSNDIDTPFMTFNTEVVESKRFDERWTGKVVDNKDSLKFGRVKVRIFGIHDNVAEEALPWAMSEQSYLGSSTANLIVPEIGSVIRGYFENDDPMKPIYNSIISSKANLSENLKETFLGKTPPGEAIMDEAVNSDYPNTMVLMKTDQGEGVLLNRKTGLMKITHRSGLKIRIDPNGSIFIEQSQTKKIDNAEPAKMEVAIEGDMSLSANGEVKLTAKKDVTIDAVLGDVNLGKNPVKNLVCTNPACFVTGAPTNGGNTNVKA